MPCAGVYFVLIPDSVGTCVQAAKYCVEEEDVRFQGVMLGCYMLLIKLGQVVEECKAYDDNLSDPGGEWVPFEASPTLSPTVLGLIVGLCRL